MYIVWEVCSYTLFFQKCDFIQIEEIKRFYENNKQHKSLLVRENVVLGLLIFMKRIIKGFNFVIRKEDIQKILDERNIEYKVI